MRTMLYYIKDYCLREYNIDFKLVTEEPTNYEKYERLLYKKGKKEYSLEVGYAYQAEVDRQAWSIYTDFMDYEKWYGSGGAYLDEGNKTLDIIMQEWGFKKESQMSLF